MAKLPKSLLAVVLLAGLPFAFFWRETPGILTLGDQDAIFWFLPAYAQVAAQLHNFQFPVWNPSQFSGMPLLATLQAGVLDPFNWLYLIVGVSSRSLTLVQQLAFAVAGLSTFAYARSIALSRRASLLAGAIFAFSGYLVARTLYPGLLHVSALAPLVLLAIERCAQLSQSAATDQGSTPRSWRFAVAGACVVAWQIFAAHPQPFVYSSMLAAAYAVYRGWSLAIGERLRFASRCVVIFGGGAALAAIQIIPVFEFVRESVRDAWPYEMFTLHSLNPLTLGGVLIPYIHGGGRGIYHLPFWGAYWHHNESQICLGAIAFSLSIAGAIWGWRVRNRIAMFWVMTAFAGVLLALGKFAGPVAWLMYRVPVINSFRGPNRYWMIVALAVAILAGHSIDRIIEEPESGVGRAARRASIGALLFVSLVFITSLAWPMGIESLVRTVGGAVEEVHISGAIAELWIPVLSTAAASVAVFVWTKSRDRKRWYWLIFGLLIVDLNLYAYFAPVNSAPRAEMQLGSALPRSFRSAPDEPFRSHLVIDAEDGEFSPLLFYGAEMASGYDPLMVARYKAFTGIDEAGRSHLKTMLAEHDRTLDLLNVRYILVSPRVMSRTPALQFNESNARTSNDDSRFEHAQGEMGKERERRRWKRLDEVSPDERFHEYGVFENLLARPRFTLVREIRIADDTEQIALIRGEAGRFDLERLALMTPDDARGLERLTRASAPSPAGGRVTIVERASGRYVLDVETESDALLVMSEQFSQEWQATVDGAAVQVRRANQVLGGLAVRPGKHRIEMRYAPQSVRWGAVISALTALILIGRVFVRR